MLDRAASGFTLAEVLVGLVMLALGILGAISMQAKSQRSRLEAHLGAQALHLASSLSDRMQANSLQLDHYLGFEYDAALEGTPALPASLCFDGKACDAAQLAAFDLYEASAQLLTQFPGGRVVICRDGSVLDRSTRLLAWQCDGDANAPVIIKIGWRGRHADGKAFNEGPRLALPVATRGAP